MSNIMIYATKRDVDTIRKWINNEPDVAWIAKVAEEDGWRHWKAVSAIDAIEEQTYALWHTGSGHLNIPSGTLDIRDAIVADPFAGWSERAKESGGTYPWFGGNTGPYFFRFAESGREAPGSLARSEFSWIENHFRSIGKPAHPEAKRWWHRLKRFVKRSSIQIPWVETARGRSPDAHVFPDAKHQIDQGRHRDVNP